MRQAVLLLAHGAPERLEDIPAYLANIRGGRGPSDQIVEEVSRRYAEIGGSSPLLRHTRSQAEALERALGLPVYFGMRNWHPYIRETLASIQADGVERLTAVCLAPQYSKLSVGFYFRRTQEAKEALGYKGEIAWTKSFHDHPGLIEAFYEKLAPLLPAERVLFTAHSLPERILEKADPYDKEAKATARAVAKRADLEAWDFAYQSQGMTDEAWLGPTVEATLDGYAGAGVREVVLAPIGFVSDHVEIAYDVDIQFRQYAERLGIALRRPDSLNDSPTFIAALTGVVREKLVAR
ncbi:MAG: ferrochelatase [Bryobacteraceae bacterium]|nr:ferrochelatase [Bryobacteraceae bacterium]